MGGSGGRGLPELSLPKLSKPPTSEPKSLLSARAHLAWDRDLRSSEPHC